jgi:hypothetical protein
MNHIENKIIGYDSSLINEYRSLLFNKFKNENLAKLLTAKLLFFLSIHGERLAHGMN